MKYKLWRNNAAWEQVVHGDFNHMPELELKFKHAEVFETSDINLVYRFLDYLNYHCNVKNSCNHEWEIKEIE